MDGAIGVCDSSGHDACGNGKKIDFFRAEPGQETEVLAVLDKAAAWLSSRGVDQSPSRFEAAWAVGAIAKGETWLVRAVSTLDCVAANRELRDYYEAAGFVHRGDVSVGGANATKRTVTTPGRWTTPHRGSSMANSGPSSESSWSSAGSRPSSR